MTKNIYPIFERTLQRKDREALIHQKGLTIWFTGLSGAGKSTLAIALEKELYREGILSQLLDGDNIRSGINNNLGFSEADRIENIRRIAEISKLFTGCGIVTLAAFISPTTAIRQMAEEIIGEDDFFEVYVSTPLAVCEQRDVKGLYARARRGEIKDFTGITSPFEPPANPFLKIDTSQTSVPEAIRLLMQAFMPRIRSNQETQKIVIPTFFTPSTHA